jgi:hypothetical protein
VQVSFTFSNRADLAGISTPILIQPLLKQLIVWSPHQQGLLVIGGGIGDRYIRFWNTLTAQSLQ